MTRPTRPTARGLRVVAGAVLAAALLVACQPHPRPGQREPGKLPPLSAVRSRLDPSTDRRAAAGTGSSTQPAHATSWVEITRFDVPLHSSIDPAWAVVEPPSGDRRLADAWRANGLRVGLLRPEHRKRFIESMPRVIRTRRERFLAGDQLAPLLTSPPLADPVTVRHLAGAAATECSILEGGRCQLLIRVLDPHAAATVIECVPHHGLPRYRLEPRAAADKQLDGRVFNDLARRVTIPPGAALLIATQLPPWGDLEDPSPPGGRNDVTPPQAPPGSHQSPPNPPPPHPSDPQAPPRAAVPGSSAGQENSTPPIAPAPDAPGGSSAPSAGESGAEDPVAPGPGPEPVALPDHFGRALLTASRSGRPITMIVAVVVRQHP